jgi:hypothetical protein
LVQSQYVTGTASDSITFSSLNGDTDKLYLLTFYLKIGGPSAAAYSVSFKPNNVATNQLSLGSSTSTSATSVGSYASSWTITSMLKGSEYYGQILIHADKASQRMFSLKGAAYTAAGGVFIQDDMMYWNETSTNLTSIVLAGSSTGNFDVGSEFHLYKYSV